MSNGDPVAKTKSKMLVEEVPVFLSPSLACAVGVNEAILLQKLYYLMQQGDMGKIDSGFRWIRMTTEEWMKELPFFDSGQIKTVIKNLTEDGLLLSKTFTGRSKWYSVNCGKVDSLDDRPVDRLANRYNKRKVAADASVKSRTEEKQEPTILENSDVSEQSVPIQKLESIGTKCSGVSEQSVPIQKLESIGTKCSDVSEQSVPIIGTKCSTSNQSSYQSSKHTTTTRAGAKNFEPEKSEEADPLAEFESLFTAHFGPLSGNPKDPLTADVKTVLKEFGAATVVQAIRTALVDRAGGGKQKTWGYVKAILRGERENVSQNQPAYVAAGNCGRKPEITGPARNRDRPPVRRFAADLPGGSGISLGD